MLLDEKHIVNSDGYGDKIRVDPTTNRVGFIPVSGNFRELWSLFAIISGNPEKEKPCDGIIQKKGNSHTFLVFITYLISVNYFKKYDVVVLDNCAIHMNKDATVVQDLLWDSIMTNGEQLKVVIIYLPARSPELNPIEFIFHNLSRKLRSFKYNDLDDFGSSSVKEKTMHILYNFSYDLIAKTYCHCGY